MYAVSCTDKGYCSGGGSYISATAGRVAFVVTESHGTWNRASNVRLPAGAESESDAQVNGISCTSRGYCAAVGYYSNSKGEDGFIVTQSHGRWGRAVTMKAPSGAEAGEAELTAISCPRWRGCEAVGEYRAKDSDFEAVAEAQSPRGWRAAEVDMPVKTAADPDAYLGGISCAGVGDCVAVGSYDNDPSSPLTSVATGALLSHGKWRRAVRLRVPASKPGDSSDISNISCNALGHCLGTGAYFLPGDNAPFYGVSITEAAGRWSAAAKITATPVHGAYSNFDGSSCITTKLCLAAGGYARPGGSGVFGGEVVTWSAGRWSHPDPLKLPAAAGVFDNEASALYALSCARDGYCAASGFYEAKTGTSEAMVATRP
jgi:hypothetical protein